MLWWFLLATAVAALFMFVLLRVDGLFWPFLNEQIDPRSNHAAFEKQPTASEPLSRNLPHEFAVESAGMNTGSLRFAQSQFSKHHLNVLPLPNVTLASTGLFFLADQARSVEGENGHPEARISIAIPSIGEVENKLQWLIEFSPDPKLRKQWKRFKEDLVDAFTEGVGRTSPVFLDVVFLPEDLSYELRIPVSDSGGERDRFLDGLRGRSYNVKAIDRDTYELTVKGRNRSHLLFDRGYAWIVTGDRPLSPKVPLETGSQRPLLASNEDLVAQLTNDTDGISVRRKNLQAFRARLEKNNRIGATESQNAFEIRKLLLKLILNESERFLVEAKQLQVKWSVNTTAPKKFGRGEIALTALADTDLSKYIEAIATKQSHFANLALHENSLAFIKLTTPLDATQVDHLKNFCNSLRPILDSEINGQHSPQTDDRADAHTRAMNLFIDMIDSVGKLGLVDVYADLFASPSNTNKLVWCVRVSNGKQADEIIKLVPSLHPEWKVKFRAHEHGSVDIHELTIGKQDLGYLQEVFDGDSRFYIGTARDVVFGAAGADCLNDLRTAIDQSLQKSPPKIDPVVFNCRFQAERLLSLYGLIRQRLSSGTKSLTLEQRRTKKDIDKFLNLAKGSFSACEPLIFGELKRVDEKIEGYGEINECVLKYVGSILGDTARDLP